VPARRARILKLRFSAPFDVERAPSGAFFTSEFCLKIRFTGTQTHSTRRVCGRCSFWGVRSGLRGRQQPRQGCRLRLGVVQRHTIPQIRPESAHRQYAQLRPAALSIPCLCALLQLLHRQRCILHGHQHPLFQAGPDFGQHRLNKGHPLSLTSFKRVFMLWSSQGVSP
jgi:hypothetical protein